MAKELEHHGIKGQRWGVRRTPEELGHRTGTKMSRRARKEEARKAKAAKGPRTATEMSRNIKNYTPEEIEKALKQFRMEREMRELSVSEMNAGKRYIDTVLGYAESGIKGYNISAALLNATIDADLPIIKTDKDKPKLTEEEKKKREDEKKARRNKG